MVIWARGCTAEDPYWPREGNGSMSGDISVRLGYKVEGGADSGGAD